MNHVHTKAGFNRIINECPFTVRMVILDRNGSQILQSSLPALGKQSNDADHIWSGAELDPLFGAINALSASGPFEIRLTSDPQKLTATYYLYPPSAGNTNLRLYFSFGPKGEKVPVKVDEEDLVVTVVDWGGSATVGLGTLDIDTFIQLDSDLNQDTTRTR